MHAEIASLAIEHVQTWIMPVHVQYICYRPTPLCRRPRCTGM